MDNTATIEIIVTDMGNGAAYCGHCWQNLDKGDPTNKIPESCPNCNRTLVEGGIYINRGGSDF